MHIVFVKYFYESYPSIEDLLKSYFTATDWAEALKSQGCKVSIIQRYSESSQFEKNGVDYLLVKGRLSNGLKKIKTIISFAKDVKKIVRDIKPDVIQMDDISAIFPNLILSRVIKDIPILVQDHGSKLVSENTLRHTIKKLSLRVSFNKIAGVFFASKGLEKEWVKQNILPTKKCFYVMENSSYFQYLDRNECRKKTRISGSPTFLWVGNLNRNKDPFTALIAFKKVLFNAPNAKFYLIFRENELEQEVIDLIEELSLKNAVFLIGKKERNELEVYYNSADYIISCSYKEGSGYSVLEAMSCGVIPILSNIPSFMDITDHSRVGTIFQVGDHDNLYKEILNVINKPIVDERTKVLKHFKDRLSFEALAKNAINVYLKITKQSAQNI